LGGPANFAQLALGRQGRSWNHVPPGLKFQILNSGEGVGFGQFGFPLLDELIPGFKFFFTSAIDCAICLKTRLRSTTSGSTSAPGVVFRASRKTRARRSGSSVRVNSARTTAEREPRPATPPGGCARRRFFIRVNLCPSVVKNFFIFF